MPKRKHKKNHTDRSNGNMDNISRVERAVVPENNQENDLMQSIKAMEAVISTAGLTDEDLNLFKSRIVVAKENLETFRKVKIEEEEKTKIYARLKADMEKKVAAIELSVKGDQQEVSHIDVEKNVPAANQEIMEKGDSADYVSNNWKRKTIVVAMFFLLIIGSYAFKAYRSNGDLGQDAIKAKVQKFVDANVQSGTTGTVKAVTSENGLYKIVITVGSQDVTAYATLDGKKLFSGAADLDPTASPSQPGGAPAASAAAQNTAPAPVAQVSQKQDVPTVELFVMSYCPYGVQIEKGLLPVLDKLGSKINFKLNFVDYSLHGSKEVGENLTQYCIQKEAPSKLTAYLKSFAGSSDSDASLTAAGIDKNQIAACVSTTDKQNNVTQDAGNATGSSAPFNLTKADNDKYGVQGSPTLVVNGSVIDAARDSASLLQTICSGFNNQPAECKATLSSTSPTPGFGN